MNTFIGTAFGICEVKVTVTKNRKTVVFIVLLKLFAIIHNVTPHVLEVFMFAF